MSCRFSHDDAAYVLGALSPTERLDFERHVDGCEECTRAVRELAGLPGLLGRVPPGVLESPPADEPLPESLLPQLFRQVRRTRRRRTFVAAGLAAAVTTAVVVPAAVLQTGDGEGGRPTTAAASPGGGITWQPMVTVGEVPVQATVGLEPVSWGTRLWLTCTYEPAGFEYGLPAAVDYDLFVRTRDGKTEQVGSWRSLGGRTMRLTAATAARRGDIASVEVRTTDGRLVLRLAA